MTKKCAEHWNNNIDAIFVVRNRLEIVIEQEKKLWAEINRLQEDLDESMETLIKLKEAVNEETE